MKRLLMLLALVLSYSLSGRVHASEPSKPDPTAGHGGVSSVDQSNGDYSYSIPIALPAFHGLEPQVSLGYSSAAANGYVGVGWSLSGFGQIVRGAPTRWGSPSFSEHDTFSLDGNLLISCESLGTPTNVPSCAADRADDNTDHVYYATQIESYAILYLDRTPSVNGGWGQWVRIDTRGVRKVYGAGYVVAQPASPNNVFKWLETTTSDPHGNTVELVWNFNLLGDCCAEYPTKVVYHYPGGPKTMAEFLWERREDIEHIALPNNSRQAFARLGAVDLFSPEGNPLRAYDLDYADGTGTATRRSLLASIDVYGTDRVRKAATATTTGAVAVGPSGKLVASRKTYLFSYIADAQHTSFTGDGGQAQFMGHAPFCTNADEQRLTGDFDGDGRTDLGCFRPNRQDATHLTVARSDGTRWIDADWGADVSSWCVDGNARLLVSDFDGDGKDDLACAIHSVTTVRSTGSKFVMGPSSTIACPLTGEPKWQSYMSIADFNGDGWSDLGCHFQGEYYVQRGWDHDGDGGFDGFEPGTAPIGWGQVGCGDTGAFGYGDFNGDGASDVYCSRVLGNPAAAVIRVMLSDGASRFVDMGDWNVPAPAGESGGFCTSKHEWNIQLKSMVTGDFNADGKTDLLCIEQDPNRPSFAQLQVSLSQGNSPGPARSWGEWNDCGIRPIVPAGDFDGDGKTDLVCVQAGVDHGFDHTYVRASTGRVFASAIDWKPKWCTGGVEAFYDIDGDGRLDVDCTRFRTTPDGPDQGHAFALAGGRHGLTQTRGPIDLLETITTPAGGTLAIGYLPASSFSNAFGPPPTGPVVTQVSTLDNQQHKVVASAPTTRYSYVGSRYDRAERRSLGYFETTEQAPWIPGDAHASLGPVTITRYLQDYGSLSKPLAIRSYDAPSGNLQQLDTFTYWVNDRAPYRSHLADEWHASCGPGQGDACTVRKQRHLSYCAAYSGSTCTSTYHDDHGNRTVIVDYGIEGSNPAPATTTVTAFAQASVPATNLVEFIADKRVHAGVGNGGTLLSRVRYGYDQLPWGQIGTRGEQHESQVFLASGPITRSRTSHDALGRITQVSDALGQPVRYEYDGYHRIVRTINPLGQDVGAPAFHPNCNVPTQFSNLGDQISTATYDSFCRITSTKDPLGPELRYSYHDIGVQSSSNATMRFKAAHVSPGGVQEHALVTYVDGLGRTYQTKLVAAHPAAANDYTTHSVLQRRSYDARGNLSGETVPFVWGDSNVPSSRITHDARGRVVERSEPGGGAVTRYRYDLATTGVWGTGVETVEQIDPLGTSTLVAPGMTSTGAFEKSCEYVAPSPGSSGGKFHCRKTSKDLLGRVITVHEPDANGSPTQLVNSVEYDMLDRAVHVWDAARGHVYTRYDLIGNPVRVLDARGTLTCLEYDALGRVTRESKRLASGVTPETLSETSPCEGASEIVESYYDAYPPNLPSNLSGDFDNVGRLTMVVTRGGKGQVLSKRSYAYDRSGRLSATALEVDGKLFRRSMTYDGGGRVATVTFPDGDVISFDYDNQGNVTGLTASGQRIAKPTNLAARSDWQYDAAGHLQYLELGNGTVRRHSYDLARGWLLRARVDKGTTNLLDYGYADRNAIGLLRSITSNNRAQRSNGWWFTDNTTNIGYDSQYHMLTAGGDLSGTPQGGKWTVSMRYSPIGEILSRSLDLADDSRGPLGLAGDYCYTGTNKHAVTSVVTPGRGCDPTAWPQGYAPPSFSYDATGNMLTHASLNETITWSGDGRPTQMTVNGVTQDFLYDGQAQRIRARNGSTTTYYDGDFEWSGAGTTKLLRIAGQIIARRGSSNWTPPSPGGSSTAPTWTTEYLHQNHISSVVLVVDAQGNPVARTIYSPWGDRIAGSKTGSHGFTGEREDDTGLLYLSARYYDPALGRFLSADSTSPARGLGSLDRYAYALGNPLRWIDPTGHISRVDPSERKKQSMQRGQAPPPKPPQPPAGGGPVGPTSEAKPVNRHETSGSVHPPRGQPTASSNPDPMHTYMYQSFTEDVPEYGSQTWTAIPGAGWGIWWVDEDGVQHEIPFEDAVKYAGIDPPDKRDPNMGAWNDEMYQYAGERSYGQGEHVWGAAEWLLHTDVLAAVCQIHDVQFEYGWAQADGDPAGQQAAGQLSLDAMGPDLELVLYLESQDAKIIVDGSVFEQKIQWRREVETRDTANLAR